MRNAASKLGTMKIARPAIFASLRGILLIAALTSVAGAQTQTWFQQFGTSDDDRMSAAAPGDSGNVYVCGSTRGSLGGPIAGSYDAWLAYFDSAGTQIWSRQFGTLTDDPASAAAADGVGGVYVSGSTRGSLGALNAGSWDAFTARYDSAGNRLWVRQFGAANEELVYASAADGTGGVYVSGAVYGSLGGTTAEAFVTHYDSAGNQTWIRQFGSTSFDQATSAAPDGSGGVYVSGNTEGSLGGPTAGLLDAWLAHYDSAGNQVWIRQFGSSGHDHANAAAPDGAGGVYVSGSTRGSLGGPLAGPYDAWLTHYDSAGNQTWIRQFGTPRIDEAFAAASDGAGGVYVSGTTRGNLGGPTAGSYDAWLAHYNSDGRQSWMRQFGTLAQDVAVASVPDGGGGVYVGGTATQSWPTIDLWLTHFDDLVTTRYCTPQALNSTGQSGELSASGSNAVVLNSLTVGASQLPQQALGFFLTSMTQGLVVNPAGSQGNLCLGGTIGRFSGPGMVLNSGTTGAFSLALDLNAWPTMLAVVQPGQTWNFQAWYRDANPGLTTNFTDAVAVTFR